MPILHGSDNLLKIYAGTKEIVQVYLGSKLLFVSDGYDLDAKNWFDRMEAAGSPVDESAKPYFSDWVKTQKATLAPGSGTNWNALTNGMVLFYVGHPNLSGCLVPLTGVKSEGDFVEPELISFFFGDLFTQSDKFSNGLQGTSRAAIKTNLVDKDIMPAFNASGGGWLTTTSSGGGGRYFLSRGVEGRFGLDVGGGLLSPRIGRGWRRQFDTATGSTVQAGMWGLSYSSINPASCVEYRNDTLFTSIDAPTNEEPVSGSDIVFFGAPAGFFDSCWDRRMAMHWCGTAVDILALRDSTQLLLNQLGVL